jgi:hypothetical protein
MDAACSGYLAPGGIANFFGLLFVEIYVTEVSGARSPLLAGSDVVVVINDYVFFLCVRLCL